jgi:hypothetical protein
MADDAITGRFEAIISNRWDTTKWIVSTFAALGAFIAGGSSLSGIGSLSFGPRLVLAVVASLYALICVIRIIFLAVRVLIVEGVQLNELVHEDRFKSQREYLEKHILYYFPPELRPLANLDLEYNRARTSALNGNAEAIETEKELRSYATLVLAAAKMFGVTENFKALTDAIIYLIVPIMISLYIFEWAAKAPVSDDHGTNQLVLQQSLTSTSSVFSTNAQNSSSPAPIGIKAEPKVRPHSKPWSCR